jgi:site-specific DNA recombinase
LVRLTELTEKHKVALASIQEAVDTSNPTGQLFRNIITSISEWERGIIAERTRDALAYKRRNGERIGTIPYGYTLAKDGRHLVPDPEEMEVLAQIERERSHGKSYESIADELNADRIPTKGKGRWYAATVRSVLQTARKREADQVGSREWAAPANPK